MKLDKIRKRWREKHDAYLTIKPENLDNSDIRYATGFTGTTAIFFQTKAHNALIVDPRYTERAHTETHASVTVHITSQKNSATAILRKLIAKNRVKNIAIEGYTPSRTLAYFKKELKSIWFHIVDNIIADVRAIKTKDEIKKTQHAQKLTDKLFRLITKQIKPNSTEKDITEKINIWAIQNADGTSFDPIIAAGKHSAIPHHTPTNKKLPKNGPLLLDFGVRYKGYCADLTRTIWIGNKPSKKFQSIYETVLQAQDVALRACRFTSTRAARDIDKVARHIIQTSTFKDAFVHSTGHGVGLDIHEKPTISAASYDILHGNEIITIEPGIYLKGNFGIRIEDIIVTGSGTNLTTAPKKLYTI